MATINVSEQDFETIASAANAAYLNDDEEEAQKLDKIARKINAALASSNSMLRAGRSMGFGKSKSLSWEDVPSTLPGR